MSQSVDGSAVVSFVLVERRPVACLAFRWSSLRLDPTTAFKRGRLAPRCKPERTRAYSTWAIPWQPAQPNWRRVASDEGHRHTPRTVGEMSVWPVKPVSPSHPAPGCVLGTPLTGRSDGTGMTGAKCLPGIWRAPGSPVRWTARRQAAGVSKGP